MLSSWAPFCSEKLHFTGYLQKAPAELLHRVRQSGAQHEQETLCLAWSGGAPWRWCLLHLLAACGLFPHGELGASHSSLPSVCSGYFLPLLPSAIPHSVPAMGWVCKRNGRKVAWWMQGVLYMGFVQDPKKLEGLVLLTAVLLVREYKHRLLESKLILMCKWLYCY